MIRLLDDFERGMKTPQVKHVFDDLKRDLIPFMAAIAERGDVVSDACLHGYFPADKQREFCLSIISRFGFKPDSWRLDPTVHPFASNTCTTDIRITTRYHEDFINAALFGSMHECGHGLYENGVSPALERTLLCRGASSACTSRRAGCGKTMSGAALILEVLLSSPASDLPGQFARVDMETFYRAVNKVQPSLIRVEADEATYNYAHHPTL